MAALGVTVALLDTAVLFPKYLRNTLLYTAARDLYQPLWSGGILSELRRVLIGRRGVSDAQIRHLVAQMQRSFPGAEVEGYEVLIGQMPVNAADRHVLAAAVHGQANVLVTTNLRHFPTSSLTDYGIAAQSPDEFLIHRLNDAPRLMIAGVADQLASYKSPSLTLAELCARLQAAGASRFAARLRDSEQGT